VVLKQKANGNPTSDNFEVKSVSLPQIKNEGDVLVHVLYLSVDPYMRGRIGSDSDKSSSNPLQPGEVIVGATVGEVISSNNSNFAVGDLVHAYSGWREYYVLQGNDITKINNSFGIPLEKYVGVMGMTGLTSYYGLVYVGEVKKGDQVLVSGGAGAVGSVVGQIAKIFGCRVVGIAGGKAKCKYMKEELEFDDVIDYKEEKDIKKALHTALPNGVDVYYDNVGGEISDSVIPLINRKARIVICGQISTYNMPNNVIPTGPRLLHHLLWKSAKMQGFLVQDFEDKDDQTFNQLGKWISEGKLKSKEDIVDGIDQAPSAFLKLFQGENFGKQVVKIGDRLTK